MSKKSIYSFFLMLMLLLGVTFSLVAQVDSSQVRISGIITASDSIESTPYVHIINKRSGRGVISDSIGVFRTIIYARDTLVFRCLGFKDFIYALPDSVTAQVYFLNIKMSPTSYKLNVIDIIALSRKSQIRHDIINMGPDPKAQERYLNIPGVFVGDYGSVLPPNIPILVGGGGVFTFMYYKWGKRGKSAVELVALLAEDVKEVEIEKKYNRKLLKEFTAYHPSKLDCFSMYLDFSTNFLYEQSDYHIFYEVKQRMIPFEFQYQEDSLTMLQGLFE